MSQDIADFLRARYAEEAAEAEKQADDYPMDPWVIQWEETGEWNSYSYIRIAKARVFAEVEVKLVIVKEWEDQHEAADSEPGPNEWNGGIGKLETFVLPLLASVYASHPDYRQEWRP